MEEHRGLSRGSYIWGRSVHNTRIERLWYDVTHGYGQKWKNFFLDLEHNHGLDPSRTSHIWLLHHLFLNAVNEDAQEWAEAWNSHKMGIRGERQRSPRDMFVFGMVQDGVRGLETVVQPAEEDVGDINTYGVDWETHDDNPLMNHHFQHNPQEWENDNPFASSGTPANMANVPCEPPNCPFSAEELRYLDQELSRRVNLASRNMEIRRIVWQEALSICQYISNVNMQATE
ncbi:hypothetical protein BD410DRAFT_734057 [Rickenella mellea]|uniref:Integrase core domain-containing protein n=1 Tax=Rickenella mellea TaxID=50990 RepID=A0A4Y7PHJ4_9AGAM|nr:hypothetical protein BD410DRAFT_734057 [Rickenella mellea]